MDPDVIKYTGNPPFESEEEAKFFLDNYNDYNKNGFGRWAVILKDTKEFICWCGLKLNEDDLIDIGFRFFKKYWNNRKSLCRKYCFYNSFRKTSNELLEDRGT